MPRLSSPAVLLVAYGSPHLLSRALDGIRGAERVIVVDNSSSPDVQRAADAFGATYVDPGDNLGFASGVNVGLRLVEPGEDVLLLNPDAVVEWSDVLLLHQVLRTDPDCAAVSPLLRRPDGSSEPVEWPMPTPGLPWWGIVGRSPQRRSTFLNGAVLLLRSEAIRDVGHFDERFFLYAEETDWQARALDLGWRVRCVPNIVAVHDGAAMSSDSRLRESYFHMSAELFIRKRFGARGWWVFRAGSLLASVRRLVLPGAYDTEVRRRQLQTLRLYLRGPVRSARDLA